MRQVKNLEQYNGIYKGSKALIIGSGPSVSNVDFSLTGDCVTIAVNSGYLANLKSQFFLSDDQSVMDWSYFFRELQNSPTTIALLYENKFRHISHVLGERSVVFRHRKGYHITDKYIHSDSRNYIAQARTSIGSAIHVAHIMGCNPIGIIGLDGYYVNGVRYFWQENPSKYNYPFRTPLKSTRIFRRIIQDEKLVDDDLNEISSYWNLHGKEFQKKCSVYNLSSNSLIEVFPKIDMKEFLKC